MTARVIDDPSALGWEYDSDTGRWTWGGGSGDGGGSGGGSFPEAPVDGKQYGRQNAGWTEIVHTGGGGGAAGPDPRISDTQISNWDTSFSWGDHASQGYLTSASLNGYATQTWVGQNYQPKGSYATSNHNHNGVYAPVTHTHNYAAVGASYTKAESDARYEAKGAGGGGTDTFDDVVSRGSSTNTSPSAPNWQCLSNTYTIGGVSGVGARCVSYDGKFVFYNSSNGQTATLNTNGNVEGTSFTSWVNNSELLTVYGNAIANSGALGAGLYFSNSASTPTITPCRGSDFAETDNTISLGNPNKRFIKVWAVNGAGAVYRHTQNGDEAVLGVRDLIGVLEDLREATREEKTVDGLRDSIGNCVGGIVERLEAIQAETEKQVAEEIAMFESEEPDPMPPFTLTPTLPSVE